MKSVLEVIKRNKVNIDKIKIPEIDFSTYKWPHKSLEDETIVKYKENIKKWQLEKYGDLRPKTYIQVIKDHYRDYLKATALAHGGKSEYEIDKKYDEMVDKAENIINTYGLGTFEYGYIGQGWFHFMNWAINNKLI